MNADSINKLMKAARDLNTAKELVRTSTLRIEEIRDSEIEYYYNMSANMKYSDYGIQTQTIMLNLEELACESNKVLESVAKLVEDTETGAM